MLFINLLILSSVVEAKTSSSLLINNTNNIIEYPKTFLITKKVEADKIGIVDFRYILKRSKAMKTLGNKFLSIENKINQKFKLKQVYLKNKEQNLNKNKINLTSIAYQKKLKLFKEEVFQIQKNYKDERSILNKSFQKIQKKIKDLLAQAIKDVSVKKNISVVLLKENVFLFNNPTIDFTIEVLDVFNKKTKSMKIIITSSN